MEHLEKLVEQLDLAVDLLRHGSAIRARLGLILTDNVVELLVHDRCDTVLLEKAQSLAPEANRLAAEEARKVLGRELPPKLSFLQRRDEIKEDEQILCLYAHQLRNEAYHLGVVHEGIVRLLAVTYHGLACDFLVRLRRTWMSLRDLTPPPIIQKHIGLTLRFAPASEQLYRAIADSLRKSCPAIPTPLWEALSDAALEHVDRLSEGLKFLANYGPVRRTLGDTIREVEFYGDFLLPAPYGKYSLDDPVQWSEAEARMKDMKINWQPKVSKGRLARWKERASGIASEDSPGRAVQKYVELLREIEHFEQSLDRAVASLDEEIDRLVSDRRVRW